jgi:hypothetical protein
LPTRFGVQFKLVRFYYAQRRAGRPRSSPSPLRGELVWNNEAGCLRSSPRRFAAIVGIRRRLTRFGISTRFTHLRDEGKPRPYNVNVFLVNRCVFRSSCRLAPTQPSGGQLPTLRLPTRLGVQFKLVWFYYALRRAGCPRSSPSPLRGNCLPVGRRRAGWFCRCVSRYHCRRAIMIYSNAIHQESPAVGCPPYVTLYTSGGHKNDVKQVSR